MKRTIASVIDDINEWNGPNGTIYYVTAFTTNEEVISVGKKNLDAAIEVQGLLREVIEVPQEFALEPKGKTKTLRDKWNLKAFGPPDGVWTYSTLKDDGSPNVGAGAPPTAVRSSTPAPTTFDVEASIRASVALKAAAAFIGSTAATQEDVIACAEAFDGWLAEKASGRPPEERAGGAGEGTGNGSVPGEAPAPAATDGQWAERVKSWPDESTA